MNQSAEAPVMQGLDQCRQFLKGLRPKGANRELWVKFGHNSIYRATWDEVGNLSGIATKLENRKDPKSRINKGKPIPDLIKHLDSRARCEMGGVFFIPTQPIGLPMAECVTETDDIGVEMDHLSMADQKAVIAEFCQVTGLEFASVLTSGGASIHLHLKADRHYSFEEMQYFRRLAVIAFQSDPVTVRAHQPMRLPGFFRKEKNAYQELLRVSDRRYTPDDLTCAFDRWFEYKGWAFPYAISSSWWSEAWRSLFASKNTVLPSLKYSQTKEFLDEGDAAYLKRRAAESEQQRERIAKLPAIAGQKISDLVQSCCDRAGLGDFDGVDWQGSGGHYRGQCPFHEGKSGSSAWLSNSNGAFRFHCSSCTDDSPRTSFEFMVARSGLSSIDSAIGLKGRDYVEAAKVFLSNYGVSLPEKPKEPTVVPIAEDKTQTIEDDLKISESRIVEIKKALLSADANEKRKLRLEKIDLDAKVKTLQKEQKLEAKNSLPDWVENNEKIGRPTLHYRPENLPECAQNVLAVFNLHPKPLEKIYYQGGSSQWLCRVLTSDERADVIEILDHDKLKNSIDTRMSFYKQSGDSKKIEAIDCPLSLSKHILSESRWPLISELKGISNIPLLLPDGSISSTPGYDDESKFILEFNPKDFSLTGAPTKKDALKALSVLKDLIKESEFKTEVDRAGALAMFLTAISRKLYDRAPLFAIDATRPGIGKGTLIDMVTTILTGNRASGTMITFSPDEEEFRKKLLSTLIEGLPILNIDNVKDGELGGAAIESALTNPVHKDRFLGASKNVHVSTQILWTANGNNIRLSKDLQRRAIIIKLDSNVPNLDQRAFSMSDHELELHLKKNRSKLVSAALTVIQAFILESPAMDWPKPLSSFSHWDSIVRRSLLWLGEQDPVKTQEQFKDEDDGESVLSSLLSAWHTLHGDTGLILKQLLEVCQPSAYGKTDDQKTLEDALKDVCYDYRSQAFNTARLKNFLRDNKGTMTGIYKLVRTDKKIKNNVVWRVDKLEDDPIPF